MLCFSALNATISVRLEPFITKALFEAQGYEEEEKFEKTIETAIGSITVVFNAFDYWLLYVYDRKKPDTEFEPKCKLFNLQSTMKTTKVKEKILDFSFLEHAHAHWVERLVRTQEKGNNDKADANLMTISTPNPVITISGGNRYVAETIPG